LSCIISHQLIKEIERHLELVYPEEGAGFLLGKLPKSTSRIITKLILLENNWDEGPRTNRFLITPQDVLAAEDQADALGLSLLGVFHSHPDSINIPSEFDRNWALPWFSYLISSIHNGKTASHRLWQLSDDRSQFHEQKLLQENSNLIIAE